MAYYRLYLMDAFSGHITEFREFEAADDAAAIAQAEEWRDDLRAELWCRHRKVQSWVPDSSDSAVRDSA